MNELRPFDPLAPDPIDATFRALMRPWRFGLADVAPRIRIDLSEQDGSYLVKAEIPGVRKEDIEVTIDGAQVTLGAEVRREREATADERLLHAERSYGKSRRSFTLPQEVDEAQAEAKFRDGVLELTLPKKSAAARKQITIQ